MRYLVLSFTHRKKSNLFKSIFVLFICFLIYLKSSIVKLVIGYKLKQQASFGLIDLRIIYNRLASYPCLIIVSLRILLMFYLIVSLRTYCIIQLMSNISENGFSGLFA